MYRSVCAIALSLVACAEDPPCQDAAIIQLIQDDDIQAASCKVTFVPAAPLPPPTYEFVMPPVFRHVPWECPELDVVPPEKHRVECRTLSGPEPTACFADGGCLSLLFWNDEGTKLREALGTSKISVGASCDGHMTEWLPYDERWPSEVFCRDPEMGSVER